jgi:hypothetical protein
MREIELTLNDLKAVLDIINLLAARGGIRGQELTAIGGVYDKYLSAIEKAQKSLQTDISQDN